MKCNKCNGEWTPPPGKSITICPFCQENLVDKDDDSGWRYFDNTKDLLAHIVAEYGIDALFGRKYYADHTSPTMPQGQKNLVKQAFDCGAVRILQDNMNSDQAHKEIAVRQAVGKLVDVLSIAQNAAMRVVWEFTNAIGWSFPESQESAIPRPAPDYDESKPLVNFDTNPDTDTTKLMTRAWQFAEDGDWKDATDYFNKVLDKEPTYASAFLGLLCVDNKVPSEDKLENVRTPDWIVNHKYYKRAAADPAIKARMDSYIQTINTERQCEYTILGIRESD